MIQHERCKGGCGRARSVGYVLVDGWCKFCGDRVWEARREVLRAQGRKLLAVPSGGSRGR